MKLNSGGAEDTSIQNSFKDKSCIERILINKRVLIKAKSDVLLTLSPSNIGGGKNPCFWHVLQLGVTRISGPYQNRVGSIGAY